MGEWESGLRARDKKKMRLRLFAIWKLIEILLNLFAPWRKREGRWIYSMVSEYDGSYSSVPFKGLLMNRKQEAGPFPRVPFGSHGNKKLFLLFPLDFHSYLLSCGLR
ncbi:MAG: hypothetical protein A2169_08365 [Deltaproteobacteria bacterium RBG_13_47_9]|nr:MAG: hypothetical protein A2169_08365 [Deltaproteobacteria bacterium RBG_13_47_9]